MECCGLAVYESEDRGDAVGSCAAWVCPGGVLLGRVPVHALRGGGGGGAPGRGIGASIYTGSSYSAVAISPRREAMALASVYSIGSTM